MALLEVERQFYGENTLTLTERNKNIGSPYVYMENFGGEVTRFMGSARPVNLFVDHWYSSIQNQSGKPKPKIAWLCALSDGQELTIMVNDEEFNEDYFFRLYPCRDQTIIRITTCP